ncbi:Eco57I restriction-modification methylase domain-containing protein [Treponema berlinense]|uniref:Eco57I restriction-modification methylase domain-containing protein n=1 Tax=Treponema berlinense TaxID=225004 RepID=UPI002353F269|nr:TaqI-like C-terminal specificity domain-containing protein [Treponema berlinense]
MMLDLRTIFESAYPGKEVIFSEVIKPIFDKAKDATLTDNQQLSESDKRLVKSFSIIAQVRGGFPITFADVELKDTVALKRSRVAIQSCVRKIMTNDSSAIIFFHFTDNTKDWRVSFVNKGDSGKDSTNAKRYTYLCGVNHGCRTIAERFNALAKLDRITDKDMISAFSVESLTKEFFGQLFTWYSDWACKVCKFPSDKCIAANADLTTEKNEINLIRLITRIMFVWFIKQKNLIPTWIFNKNELAEILTDADFTSDKKGNYYNAVLQNLFFGALNKKIEERAFAEVSKAGVANEQYGIKTYFRDANEGSFFKLSPKEMVKKFLDVPFLNGGLFECLDWDEPTENNTSHKVHYVDGFSRDKDRRAFVPNILFWNEDEKQPGLITILSRYNFTVEESTPSDVQVALDPELLGKIFENLLGTYNPETRESARKESGSFYTPREIVSYMVNSSIKSYLQEKVPDISEENLERLTNDNKDDDSEIKLSEEQINKVRSSLFEIKIIDPACGSGAFPMGILNKLVEIHVLLDRLSASTKSEHNLYIKKGQSVNYNPDESLKINAEYLGNQEFKLYVNGKEENTIYNSQDLALHVKEIINKHNKKIGKSTIANLFSQGRIDDGKSFNSIKTKTDIHQIVDEDTKDIIWQYRSYNVQNKFRQYRNEEKPALSIDAAEEDNDFEYAKYLYSLKTRIIQDSIFGVDIQPIAVQISKLRFFISLICEQPKIENHPEENYGYNPLPNLETKFVAANTLIGKAKKTDDMALFANPRIDEITKKLGEIRKVHFSAKTAQEKKENREQDEKLRKELSKLLEEDQVYSPEDAKQLAAWNPYDQSAPASSFFDAEWMFGVKDGFDVVIGNPPYVRVQNIKYDMIDQLKSLYKTACKRIDISLCFIEKSKSLLHKNSGVASYVISNQFLTTEYGKAMREFLLKEYFISKCIDLGDLPIFESAMTYVSVFVFTPKKIDSMDYYPVSSMESVKKMDFGTPTRIYLDTLTSDNWNLKKSKLVAIFSKMKNNSTFLENIGNCNAGLFTGCDKVLMFDKDDLSSINIETEILLPVLRAENCSKWNASEPTKYVIYPYFEKDGKTCLYSENDLKKKFPKAYKYLYSNRDVLANRKDSRVTMEEKGHWYGLVRFGRKEMFNKLKIISPGEVQSHKFCLDDTKSGFSCARVFAITLNNSEYNIKYVLGIMNTDIMKNFIQSIASLKSGGYYQYSSNILNRCPIPSAPPAQQKPIIALVDKILAAKKDDPQADTSKEEAEIDRLVYALYGLSEDEIKVVEGR